MFLLTKKNRKSIVVFALTSFLPLDSLFKVDYWNDLSIYLPLLLYQQSYLHNRDVSFLWNPLPRNRTWSLRSILKDYDKNTVLFMVSFCKPQWTPKTKWCSNIISPENTRKSPCKIFFWDSSCCNYLQTRQFPFPPTKFAREFPLRYLAFIAENRRINGPHSKCSEGGLLIPKSLQEWAVCY